MYGWLAARIAADLELMPYSGVISSGRDLLRAEFCGNKRTHVATGAGQVALAGRSFSVEK